MSQAIFGARVMFRAVACAMNASEMPMLHIFLTKLVNALFGLRYHPERHYMRGPGPACRAATTASPVSRR
jgi:hypothetical protein